MIIKPELLRLLRSRFQTGRRVRLIQMNDPYTRIMPGDEGTVSLVDDTGTIFVDWDIGSRLGVVHGEDRCELIEMAEHE